MRSILQTILTALAKAYLAKYKPRIVAVTGNVGKTSTKEAIAAVLGTRVRVRYNGGNLNNELGVPLTIIGEWADEYYYTGSTLTFWLRVLTHGVWGLLIAQRYPDILVLEYAADRPGDIERLATLFRPHIAVVTAVGDVPVHVEYFAGPQEVAREKSKLVEGLTDNDYAILNFDDPKVYAMREQTEAQVLTFGSNEGADIRVMHLDINFTADGMPLGIVFKIQYAGTLMPMKISGSLGKSQAFAAAAAVAVGAHFGMNLVEISDALGHYKGPAGRLRILKGIKGSVIVDDTYNASPSAMFMALDTLAMFPKGRKVAILGSMLELGKYSFDAHQDVGIRAGQVAELLICVGEKAKFIADAAKNHMPEENIHFFHTSEDARMAVQELIQKGDIVLVKGSQGVRMEKVVEEIMAEPLRKRELLVRQSGKWQTM